MPCLTLPLAISEMWAWSAEATEDFRFFHKSWRYF